MTAFFKTAKTASLFTLIGLLAILLATGCATEPTGTSGSANLAPAKAAKDKVLWQYRDGLDAMRKGNFAEAKAQFDAAIERISNIYGIDKSGKKARNYFNSESKKNFIGEPYERVMAYYYRGILYWMDGEPDNARACFRSAQLMDSDTEHQQYSCDYVTLDYLDGLASTKLNADGSDALVRAQKSSKIGTLPPYDKNANVLVFFEFGHGPTKYASGEYGETLRFNPGVSQTHGAWLRIANQAVKVGPYDDLNFQATTRGGRVMDQVLANKAAFKGTTDAVGNAAILGGAVVASNRGTQEAGLGLLAAGLLGKIISAATTPEADVRAWDTLPQYLSFAAVTVPPGSYAAAIEFTDAGGNVLPLRTRTVNITVPPVGRDVVLFVSDPN